MIVEELSQVLVVLQRLWLFGQFARPFRVLQRLVRGRKDCDVVHIVELIVQARRLQQALEDCYVLLRQQSGHGQRRIRGQNGVNHMEHSIGAHYISVQNLGGIVDVDGRRLSLVGNMFGAVQQQWLAQQIIGGCLGTW